MSPTLEDQERHLLVKVIDRVLYKLDDLVRPFVHKILVVIEPLLIDEDYYARVEGIELAEKQIKKKKEMKCTYFFLNSKTNAFRTRNYFQFSQSCWSCHHDCRNETRY